jgi:hypothetical protein
MVTVIVGTSATVCRHNTFLDRKSSFDDRQARLEPFVYSMLPDLTVDVALLLQ